MRHKTGRYPRMCSWLNENVHAVGQATTHVPFKIEATEAQELVTRI
jgi:hypothetical protein